MRWSENPYWQYFCGETYFQHQPPLNPSSLTRWRQRLAKAHDIPLRQSYVRMGPRLLFKNNRYGHARQLCRQRRTMRKLKTVLGRVYRDIERRLCEQPASLRAAFAEPMALTKRSNLVVGAQSLPGSPYDGHTLGTALKQVERLTGIRPERCFVDLGYRGHDVTDVEVFKARQKRGVTRSIRRELKRRNAIEPIIGHMKNDGLMHRNYLKGTQGDAINVILCGAGQKLADTSRKSGPVN